MTEINMLEAKTNLTKLIKLLETRQEDEIVICRNGKPCAKLIYFNQKDNLRIVGRFEGKYPSLNLNEFNNLDDEITNDFVFNADEDLI